MSGQRLSVTERAAYHVDCVLAGARPSKSAYDTTVMREIDVRTRRLLVAVGVASALVFARSAVYVWYPQSFFDSDQAIIGLMAKHLIEGRAFPLFYYGQTYLLGVDAWVAAPFFLVAGPTVAALHAANVFVNLLVVTLLVVGLVRWSGLTPALAVAASLFFAFAPPFTSASLIEAGANIGPFVYVLVLWVLRDRPLWFGAVLAFGFLNREFTIYAAPALLVVQAVRGELFRLDRIRTWLLALVTFLAVWQTVEILKPYADLMGPGTKGELVRGAAGSEVGNILTRVSIVPGELLGRARVMATDFVPRQLGARYVDSWIASQGHDWLFWPLAIGLVAVVVRAAILSKRASDASAPTPEFAWYLAGVGTLAAGVYAMTRPATGPVDRYLLLTIYAPIGVVAALFSLEPVAWIRRAVTACLLLWAISSGVDHARLAAAYLRPHEPDEVQALADGLVARGIRVAAAGYWRAYRVTFLARERVKVASTDVNRIDEYRRLANAEGDRLIVISDEPCAGDRLGRWYLCQVPR
jgi:hypothetical protein